MRLFVDKTKTLPVTVYAFEVDGKLNAVNEKEEIPAEKDVEIVNLSFRYAGQKDSVSIMRGTKIKLTSDEEEGEIVPTVDPISFQNRVWEALIADWDIKGLDGEKLPFTEENKGLIDPAIVRSAVSKALESINI